MGKGCDSCVGFIEQGLKTGLDRYARYVTRHPLPFLLAPLALTVCLLPGLLRYNYVYDSEYLYTPVDGPAKDEREIMESTFPNNETDLYISTRKLDLEGYLQVVLTGGPGGNMYSVPGMDAALLVDSIVKNFSTSSAGQPITFTRICSKWKGDCEENPIFELLDWNPDNVLTYDVQYPVSHGTVFLGYQLGGVRCDANGTIVYADGIMLSYNVQYLEESVSELSYVWLDEVKDLLFTVDIADVQLVLQTSESLDQELDAATQDIILLFSATYTILCTFSLLSCMMLDWVRSKMWVALAGQVSAGLAIASAIGFACAVGVPFASICSTMPFLLMGIGIDNMFVLVAAWRDTPVRAPVDARMGEAFSKAAVSITLTSLTDCLAFGIGAISPFRSVKYFCAYAGTACAFCYLYSVTFLAACMVYSGRQEHDNRHITSCRAIDPDEAVKHKDDPLSLSRVFCWGSAVYHDDSEDSESKAVPAPDYEGAIPETVVPYLTTLIAYPYAHYLLKWQSKVLVLLTYMTYLGVGIYGCTQLQEGLELQNLAPDDSYLQDFYADYDPLFSTQFSGRVMVAMTETLDYTSPNHLLSINALVDSFRQDEYFFDDDDLLEFWLYDYQAYLASRNLTVGNMTEFIQHLHVFLAVPGFDRYSVDIVIGKDNEEITASRFLIQARGVQSTTEESELMLRSRSLAKDSDIEATAYFSAFIYWDQYIIVLVTTMTNLCIAVVCVLFVSFLLVPSVKAVAMVGLSICSICVGVVGYMTFWDVSLDSVSMINLVLCIGFSVDFSAHICYHFSSAHKPESDTKSEISLEDSEGTFQLKGNDNFAFDDSEKSSTHKGQIGTHTSDDTPSCETKPATSGNFDSLEFSRLSSGDAKAMEALSQLGVPIIQGALSTILGVSVLSTSNTYIFRTFFKIIFLVMCFGFYHAMVILPVVLSSVTDCFCARSSSRSCSRSNSDIWPSSSSSQSSQQAFPPQKTEKS